ncbi:hypothetical protein G9A89_023609 [Geosiphon pyriformis]|nr:hypothetical protein G9A89_023609 [Geosiphon pyriformis]
MIRAKSKKAALDICSEISNKISIREAFSVVEATRQNVLEAFPLPSDCEKLSLVAIKATSSSLAGFLPVKVLSKRHTWVSPNVASISTKSPKVFNNRPVNKLQSLASTIVAPNPFVVPNKILDEISVALSNISSKMGQNQPLAVLPNVMFSGRSSPVLEAKQSSSVGSPVFGNWANQMETDLFSSLVSNTTSGGAWETITSCQRFAGFLDAKSVLKDNVKLFCVEFASQVSLKAAFLVELTSFVHLATLKIAKSLVISESGSSFAAVALHDMPLGVSTANIKTALGVFGSVTYVVLKPTGIWQYVVVYFESLDSAVFALNYWSVLVDKDSVRILSLTKLVNLSSGCTAFEISDMIFQVGGWTCFIPQFPDFGYCSQFALVTFGSQKTSGYQHCFKCQELDYLAADCKVSLPFLPKISKVFTSHFVGSKSYAKASALLGSSGFPPLSPLVFSPVVVGDSLLFALVESIVKPVGFLVKLFEQFVNGDLVLSSKLGLKINEVMMHMGSFNRVHLIGLDDEVFFNLTSLWEHEPIDVKTNDLKTAEWLVRLKMSALGKFSSKAST